MRLQKFRLLMIGSAWFSVAWISFPASAAEERPNVLFIIADDLRAETGADGGKALTPNLDSLAAAGVRFSRAYCQYPLCNPSRTSMLNGRHPTTTQLFGNREWIGARHPDWVSLPKWFKQNGYVTMRAGKVFHGGIDDTAAWSQGGQRRVWGDGPRPAPEGFTPQPRPRSSATPDMSRQQRSDRGVVLETENGEGYGDYMVADLAIDYLRNAAGSGQPWFIVCGFSKPHSPLEAPQRFFDLYDIADIADIELTPDYAPTPTVPKGFPAGSIRPRNADLFIGRESTPEAAKEMTRAYLASTSWMDWNAGRVIDELDRLGLRNNTIVVFWGDHGYQLGEKGKWSKAGSLWEQGCRVPTLIHDPRAKGNGMVSPRIVQSIDFYPTLVDLCELPMPSGLEGLSLEPLLANPNAAWDHPAYTVWSENGQTITGVSVRTARWHYAEFFGRGAGAMLLDPINDPHEMTNLATAPQHADRVANLSELIRAYVGDLTAPPRENE
jgi:iduronate 2-sulfatase